LSPACEAAGEEPGKTPPLAKKGEEREIEGGGGGESGQKENYLMLSICYHLSLEFVEPLSKYLAFFIIFVPYNSYIIS
jgi:hypothetical protein